MGKKLYEKSHDENEVISSDEPEPVEEEAQCEQETEPELHPFDMGQRSVDLAAAIRGEAAKMELGSDHLAGGTFAGAAMRERDPWQHRSENMKCLTCMWYVRKGAPPDPERGFVGRCRKHAPVMTGYPVVFASDWCGDHKLNELSG
jgi:hypothetical protein